MEKVTGLRSETVYGATKPWPRPDHRPFMSGDIAIPFINNGRSGYYFCGVWYADNYNLA